SSNHKEYMVLTMKTPTTPPTTTTTPSAFIVASYNIKNFIKFIKMQQFMAIMIIMVIINADLISAKTTDIDKQLNDIRNKCIKNTFVTKEQSKMILSNKILTKDSDWANTPLNVQCYFYCFLEEFGFFKNGKPNERVLRENLSLLIDDKKKSDTVLNKCMKSDGKDKCTVGFNFVLCVIKETD
ncbi:hypothetical protein DOY81_014785, partial [Sarcophaga bullata]